MRIDQLPSHQRESLTYLATHAGRRGHAGITALMERAGLAPHHFTVVSALAEFGALSQGGIADRTLLNRGHIVGYLDDLEERGLVQRTVDPSDRRRNIVQLTPNGEEFTRRIMADAQRNERETYAMLTAAEQRQLRTLLSRVVGAE